MSDSQFRTAPVEIETVGVQIVPFDGTVTFLGGYRQGSAVAITDYRAPLAGPIVMDEQKAGRADAHGKIDGLYGWAEHYGILIASYYILEHFDDLARVLGVDLH